MPLRCIIIHGCPSEQEKELDPETRTYDKHWLPWTKRELIARGIPTDTPLMPQPWHPDYKAFSKTLEAFSIDEHTVLVGHSCGCAFLVRWLGETKRTIHQLILVAPWKIPSKNSNVEKSFYTYDIDPTIRRRVGSVTIFTADNEESDGKDSAQIFHQALGGELVELRHHGHYTLRDMKTEEFPELIDTILK